MTMADGLGFWWLELLMGRLLPDEKVLKSKLGGFESSHNSTHWVLSQTTANTEQQSDMDRS